MRENLTEVELDEAQHIQERLDNVRLRIEHAMEKEISATQDLSHLMNTLRSIKYWVGGICEDAEALYAEIERRQWEEWNKRR